MKVYSNKELSQTATSNKIYQEITISEDSIKNIKMIIKMKYEISKLIQHTLKRKYLVKRSQILDLCVQPVPIALDSTCDEIAEQCSFTQPSSC